jgi:hypothetical protein
MSYVGIKTTGEVTDDLRRTFVRLAIESELNDSSLWSIMGDDQALIRGAGCFHKEGKYLLKQVAKNWKRGNLYAPSSSFRDPALPKVYYVEMGAATLISTSKEALSKLTGEATLKVWGVE